MKIGIDARILQGERRGQGQYVYYLVKNLLKIDKVNEYILFYNGFKKSDFIFSTDIPNLKQIWCRIPGRLLRTSWEKFEFPPVEDLIGGIDLFHNTFNFNFTHYTPIPSKAKTVVTFHGMADASDVWIKYDPEKINRWLRLIANRASKITVVSNSVMADLLRREDVPREKIKVVYCGVSEEFKPVEDKAVLEKVLLKYGLLKKRYVLYVGGAEKNKNLSGLLQAFLKVSNIKALDDVCLVLAGKIDENFRGLMEQSKQSGLGKRVIFTDYVSHRDLPFIYNGAELFVLPSFHEWFGIPLLEAMASNVPVAASNCCGVPEVVGDAAASFDPNNIEEIAAVISNVLQNKGLQEELKQKGIKRAAEFSWQKTAERTLEVYKEVLGA